MLPKHALLDIIFFFNNNNEMCCSSHCIELHHANLFSQSIIEGEDRVIGRQEMREWEGEERGGRRVKKWREEGEEGAGGGRGETNWAKREGGKKRKMLRSQSAYSSKKGGGRQGDGRGRDIPPVHLLIIATIRSRRHQFRFAENVYFMYSHLVISCY